MKNTILMLVVAIMLAACVNTKKDTDVSGVFAPEDIMESVFAKPDSLCSSKELAVKNSVMDIFWEYTELENNRMKFTGNRDLFMSQGLHSSYYDIVVEDIRSNNKGLDKWEADGVEVGDLKEIFETAREAYFAQRNTEQE